VLRNNPETKAMSTDVYERISSQIANEFESGARPGSSRGMPSSKERITHSLRGTSGADVKGASHAAA
jgi:hypothetical protein